MKKLRSRDSLGFVLKALFFTYLVLFPFGQLTRIPLYLVGSEVHFYMTDVVLFLLLLSWGIWRFGLKKKKYQLPPLALPIFLFAIVAGLSLGVASPLLSNREVMVSGLYLVRWLVYAGLYFVVFDVRRRLFKPDDLLNYLIIIGIAVALFGFVQFFLYPNLKALEVLEWDPHYYRLVSTFLDPGFTGLILVLTLVTIFISYKKKKSWWLVIGGLIVYVALILTHSRSSYLAFMVAMGLISWLKKNIKVFAVAFIVLLLFLAILPQPKGEGGKLTRTYSIVDRFESWQNALTITKDHPLLGVGFNAYRYAQRDYGFLEEEKWQVSHAGAGADSSLLFVLATTGVVGLVSYLWYLVKAFGLSYWQRKKIIGVVCLASLGATVVHSFFLNSLFYPWIMGWLAILLACL